MGLLMWNGSKIGGNRWDKIEKEGTQKCKKKEYVKCDNVKWDNAERKKNIRN